MVGVIIASMVGMGIQEETKGMAKPTLLFLLLFTATGKLFSFVQFIGFFGPLIGIFLGFDSVNRERVSRTLSKLVSQPIYRDSVINAKFLSGVTIIGIVLVGIVLLISGLGIRLIGVIPGPEEIFRLAIYVVISLLYIAFWLGISILFFGRLPEYGYFSPCLVGHMDLFLLLCEPGRRANGRRRRPDQSERRECRSRRGHEA